jgi:hypothetical protein
VVEVPTWHLHCAEVLGPAYAQAIREATGHWFTDAKGGPEGPPVHR